MVFINESDIEGAIRDEHLSAITDDDSTIIDRSELASITEIKSYLIGKYDAEKLFEPIPTWSVTVTYPAASIVYYDGLFYVSDVEVLGQLPTDLIRWAVTPDPRDPLIVEYMVDLILYRIHSRLAPNQIPEHRITRRDNAISFLEAASKYTRSVPWPQEELVEPASITWGSNTQESKEY